MTDAERADVLFLGNGLPLCTRAELWAAIEEHEAAAIDYGANAELGLEGLLMDKTIATRERLRALLGLEPE